MANRYGGMSVKVRWIMEIRTTISNPFLTLFYTLFHSGGLFGDEWEEHVDTSPWWNHQHYDPPKLPKKKKPKKPKTEEPSPIKDIPEYVEPPRPPKLGKTGIRCRGVWIDLREDEDGCWLKTPYYIGVKADSLHADTECVHRCHTMNDVLSAAAVGLLFSNEISATQFVQQMRVQNEMLNEQVEMLARGENNRCADW